MLIPWIVVPGHDIGFIPYFIEADDPRPAAAQFADRYIAGWQPMDGFTLDSELGLRYPGDPIMHPIAGTRLRDECIFVYPYSWVLVRQRDGAFECSRMD